MAKTLPQLTRCKIRIGQNLNRGGTETNDKNNWGIDGPSGIDPRQAAPPPDTPDGLRA